jgi:hypothetical protein
MSESEFEDTVLLANKILDRISADPDDDLAMLSRQFLRACEELERLRGVVEDLSDHGVAAERMALLKRQQEEIERLKREIAKLKEAFANTSYIAEKSFEDALLAKDTEIDHLKALLTRAADALDFSRQNDKRNHRALGLVLAGRKVLHHFRCARRRGETQSPSRDRGASAGGIRANDCG